MKRLYVILLVGLYFMAAAVAQQPLTAEQIKNDPSYIYGEGTGRMDSDADQMALSFLISQISVNVAADFRMNMSELKTGSETEGKSRMEAVVRTYSANILTNTKCLFVSHEPDAHVIRYIKVSELNGIFQARESRARRLVVDAQRMADRGKVDDALRYYYWGLCLLKSVQRPDTVTYNDHLLIDWIPQQMNDIFTDLKTVIAKKEGEEVELSVTFRDNPVVSLDFQFYDGRGYVQADANSGLSEISLRSGFDPKEIQLKYVYEYGAVDQDIRAVMDSYAGTPFKKAQVRVKAGGKKEMREAQAMVQKQVASGSEAVSTLALDKAKEQLKTMDAVISAINARAYASVKGSFTDEGYGMFEQLIQYGQASIVGTPQMSFYRMGDRVVCRSIPMRFSFQNNRRTFMENVTFTFDAAGRIECVAFALDEAARKDIFTKGAWPDSVRMVIATFLENYKTAFALKRLDYIESIFADDAVIITGHVLKRAPALENTKYLSNEYVKYTRQGKQQYLRNLRQCFGSNEFINVRFTDNDVVKLGAKHGESYGILLHQDYYSSSYSDTGYLCLLVDFNDPTQPMIRVRTWQPARDPSLTPHVPQDNEYWGLYSPYSF